MTETVCAVDGCGYPAHNHRICQICQDQLTRDLAELPALLDDLAVTLSRQIRITIRSGSRSITYVLPYDPRASEAADVLRSTLVGWVREIHYEDEPWPADEMISMSLWLFGRRDLLIDHPAAEQACDEIRAASALCKRVTDRPPSRIYAGTCGIGDCTESLYAWPAAVTVLCRGCGSVHNVDARRQQMLDQLDEMLMTPAEVSRLASYFINISVERAAMLIRSWERRERIIPHTINRDGVGMYPFGELRQMLLDTPTRQRAVVA